MRVLFLTLHFPPDMAPTGQLVEDIARDLVRGGHEALVVTGRPTYATEGSHKRQTILGTERHHGVEVLRLNTPSLGRRGRWGRLLPFAAYTAMAAAALPFVGPVDLVFAQSVPPLLAGLLAAGFSRLRSVPFVYNLQDLYPEIAEALGVLRPGPLMATAGQVEARLRRQASAIVVPGEDMRARVASSDGLSTEVTTIPNWIDTEVVHPVSPDQNRFLEKHGLAGKFVVLYSGNLGAAHDADVIVPLAAELSSDPEILMVVVGGGGGRGAVEAEAKRRGVPNLLFLPYQPRAWLADSLSAASVSLVLQRQSTTGLLVPSKLYGILAAGRPTVAAVPAASEVGRVVAGNEVGVVVPPGDALALAEAMRALKGDPARLARMGRRARRVALGQYTRELSTQRYIRLFERLAQVETGGRAHALAAEHQP